MCNVINGNIFFNLKNKLSSFKVIKSNKLFLKFLPILYLNRKNIVSNQGNSVKEIIYFISKRLKNDFLKSNKFIFALKVFLFRTEEMKLKNDFFNLNRTFFRV